MNGKCTYNYNKCINVKCTYNYNKCINGKWTYNYNKCINGKCTYNYNKCINGKCIYNYNKSNIPQTPKSMRKEVPVHVLYVSPISPTSHPSSHSPLPHSTPTQCPVTLSPSHSLLSHPLSLSLFTPAPPWMTPACPLNRSGSTKLPSTGLTVIRMVLLMGRSWARFWDSLDRILQRQKYRWDFEIYWTESHRGKPMGSSVVKYPSFVVRPHLWAANWGARVHRSMLDRILLSRW